MDVFCDPRSPSDKLIQTRSVDEHADEEAAETLVLAGVIEIGKIVLWATVWAELARVEVVDPRSPSDRLIQTRSVDAQADGAALCVFPLEEVIVPLWVGFGEMEL